MIALGGELTLRETVHQVEALRRVDEAAMWALGCCARSALFRRTYYKSPITSAYFEQISNPRYPLRGAALGRPHFTFCLVGAEMSMRSILAQPTLASEAHVGRDLRDLVDRAVGPCHSVQGLQRALVLRRAAFHPDRARQFHQREGHDAWVGYHFAYLLFDAMAQVAENPRCQRALFPRGDRWTGEYTRETAMRDLKRIVPVLGYLLAMLALGFLHDTALILTRIADQAALLGVRCGLVMPNEGAGDPQMLALPAP